MYRLRKIFWNVLLLSLWLWLFRSVFAYLSIIFTREEFRTNQIVLLGILVLIGIQVKQGKVVLRLNDAPALNRPALLIALSGAVLYLLAEHFLDINTLSATLFGLASYGLLGAWMQPRAWRMGLPAALLLIGALPFGEHMQTFIGYPLRILTADIVRSGLSIFGVHSIGIDTILVFENGVSKVDLPCSGIKSLWTGGIFFLAATWIEQRRIGLRWLLAGAVFILLLFAANLVRVALLVLAGQVMGWALLAEMIHVPLGVLGFALACAGSVVMLRRAPTWAVESQAAVPAPLAAPSGVTGPSVRAGWLAPGLCALLLGLSLLYTPKADVVEAAPLPAWQFPAEMTSAPWPLTPQEQRWLSDSGVQTADRWRFVWRGQPGTLMLVQSSTWRAHHNPERCFEVFGLSVESDRTDLLAPDFPVRLLTLGGSARRELVSAAYWLQSRDQTTDDFATRIWADLTPQPQNWVMVTILFDDLIDSQSADTHALYAQIRSVVQASFTEER